MKQFVVIGIFCALTAVAADDKAKPEKKAPAAGAAGMMPMPKPGPETRDLRQFVGTWKTQDMMEKVEGMSPGGEGTSTEVVTSGPGGFSIVLNIKGATGPMASYRALGVMSWNAEDKEYRMSWVDNMTAGLTLETGHKEGNDIVMKGEMKMGGKTYKTRDVLSDRTPTSYTLTSYADDGKGEKKTMTIKATKEEKPKEEKSTK